MSLIRQIYNLYRCCRGPRLFRKHSDDTHQGKAYVPNIVESGADKVINVIRFCYSFTYWTSPVVLTILYRRGYFTQEGGKTLLGYVLSISFVYGLAYMIRGMGRAYNADYTLFLEVLLAAEKSCTPQNRKMLAGFDFEFWGWPIDFKWSDVNNREVKRTKIQVPKSSATLGLSKVFHYPATLVSYMCAHTFGRRMMYPGATALMNTLLGMVICCEGNAGFYEIGCTVTPMEAGYSVLGWNHPGFAGSSGAPLPDQEQSAIDSVIQYAIHKLGFMPDNIALFAWSIGGYSATWAAMNYPDISFVILDATFDHVLPLAEARMPKSFNSITKLTINNYLNLENSEQLCRYPGPILLIRRLEDEMITTQGDGRGTVLESNRGNYLLQHLLQYRYPNIVDETTFSVLSRWLSKPISQQEDIFDSDLCLSQIKSYINENSESFPCLIGEGFTQEEKENMTLFLASKYMSEFNSTHCSPLPSALFHRPWTLGM
ncbi:Hypothetical predicted protein [Mytilus galloprovincialis]|uniref:AB hydrolase-1 domain-containing protein n=1 Tax=Mytilus galloprovincialis TaxID=29158 RepID=A0A8B6HGW1_MYTGA|nr:Hypothetical predicted protein [Mytilus galloprovincialis]